ncbi:hypothetical protein [Mesoflavibacter sp. CH_XMU1404-2]|uniref:hypothetical protein n=1 Tax=Mesoflavibacter sp. CH_XMU1404-2 TaxID=3107766 RepID=UPI00300897EB
MKKLILIVILFSLFSCDVQKKAIKNKTDRQLTEQIETKTYRPGDTISIDIPNIKLKDTVIERVSYKYNKPSIARVTYDENGNIKVECLQAQIEETNRINRQLLEVIKDKNQEKTENFKPQYFIYALAVLVLFVVIGFVIISNKINKIKLL